MPENRVFGMLFSHKKPDKAAVNGKKQHSYRPCKLVGGVNAAVNNEKNADKGDKAVNGVFVYENEVMVGYVLPVKLKN